MATPLTVFRKYTGWMMAVLCVLLMFVFVVGDPLTSSLQGGAGQGGPSRKGVAVTYKGGSFSEAELAGLIFRRVTLDRFMRSVLSIGQENAQRSGAGDLRPRVQPILLPTTREQGVEQSVVQMKLLADAAKKSGILVGDAAVRDYVNALGFDRVSSSELRDLAKQLQRDAGPAGSLPAIFDGIRELLAVQSYLGSFTFSRMTVLPEQRLDYWRKLYDRMILEVVPVRAETLLDKAPEPTDAELTAFYEEHKDFDPQPVRVAGVELPSPDPGFAVPRMVTLQYLRADFNAFVDKAAAEVTDEEVAKYYEENKNLFVATGEGLFESEPAADGPPAEQAPAEDAPAEESSETEPAAEETPAAEGAAAEPATTGEASETEAPADKSTPSEAAPPATGEPNSALPGTSPFRLAAYQTEATETAEAPGASAETATTEPATESAEPASGTEAAATETPAAVTPDTEDLLDELAKEITPGAAEEEDAEKPKNYQPLEAVAEEIRQSLARERAGKKIVETFEPILADLKASYNQYFSKLLDAEDSGAELPKPPAQLTDLTPLAKQHNLTLEKLGPISVVDLVKLPIGKAIDVNGGSNLVLAGMLFEKGVLEPYDPVLVYDRATGSNDLYLAMKVSETPRKIPKLEEIRDAVVRAWKMRKAADLALERAKQLAADAKPSGLPLREFFASDNTVEVQTTAPFTWLGLDFVDPTSSRAAVKQMLPEPLIAPGPEFMEAVFNLKVGETAAALNHDRSNAYVVRMAEKMESPAEMQRAFLQEANRYAGLPNLMADLGRLETKATLDGFEIDWKRTPDSAEPEESEESDSSDAQ